MVKERLYSDNHEEKVKVCYVLDYVFGITMKLLHPFMPFVTTKIDESLVRYNDKDLMVSRWPKYKEELKFEKEENQIEQLKEVIVAIRNLRTNMNVHPSKKSKLIFVTTGLEDMVNSCKAIIKKLGFASEIEVRSARGEIEQNSSNIMTEEMEVIIPFGDLVDMEEEKKRLETEVTKLESEVTRCEKMLSNPGFTSKAPEAKINEEKEKLAKYQEMLKASKERLEAIK